MAKAQITLPDGTKVHLQGTPDEIAAVTERLASPVAPATRGPAKPSKTATKERRGKVALVDLVGNLIDGGFFKKPKDLASIRTALEEIGHHYPVTTLSGTMLSLVRKRQLRRLKKDNRWMYTG